MSMPMFLRLADLAAIRDAGHALFTLASFSAASGRADIAGNAIRDGIALLEHAAEVEAQGRRSGF